MISRRKGAALPARWRRVAVAHGPWIGIALLALALLGVELALALAMRTSAIEHAKRQVQQLARSLAYPLAESISDADAVLGRVAEAHRRSPAEGLRNASAALDGHGSTWLRALAVMGPDGTISASTDPADIGMRLSPQAFGPWPEGEDMAIGHRISARQLGDLRVEGSAESGPTGLGSAVLLRRAVHPEHGEALVVGLLAVDGLVNRLQTLALDGSVAVAVVDYQGALLGSSAVTQREPRTLAPLRQFLPRFESGLWEGEGLLGDDRIGAFVGTSTLPLAVWVEMPRDEALSAWRQQSWRLAAAAVAQTLALVMAAALVHPARRTLRRSRIAAVSLPVDRGGPACGAAAVGLGGPVTEPSATDAELQAARARMALVDVLAREIRQPLQTVLGWAELGHARGTAAGSPPDVYARILGASHHIQSLVDDLSPESDSALLAATLDFRPTDLRTVAAQVFADLQHVAHDRERELRLEQEGSSLHARVDPESLREVVAHLVLHALDGASAEQAITVSVRRNGSEEGSIAVIDGSGARLAAQWAGLYGRRTTRSPSARTLDRCRRIVAAHSGRIHTSSEGDLGVVRLIVPLAAGNARA